MVIKSKYVTLFIVLPKVTNLFRVYFFKPWNFLENKYGRTFFHSFHRFDKKKQKESLFM